MVNTFLITQASKPVVYVYGSGGTVHYVKETVYVQGEPQPAEKYYEDAQKQTEAPRPAEADAEKVEWLPLGVFAYRDKDIPETTRYLQLAVTKDGTIGGTYTNEATNVSRPIEGTVDKKTQRAAWGFADGEDTHIVMETGIYNLTENEASVLVHFGPDKRQEGTLVRLEAPMEDEKDANGGGNAKSAEE